MASSEQIQGLPPGATLKPIEGLPAGAEVRPIAGSSDSHEDDRNAIQRGFDKLTTVTPEQENGLDPVTKQMQRFGAGAIQGIGAPFVHPLDTLEGVGHTLMHPIDTATSIKDSAMADPARAFGNLVGGGVLGMAGEAAAVPLINKIPTQAKAGQIFNDIRTKMANTPIPLNKSAPWLQQIAESDAAGGSMPTAASKLLTRSQAIEPIEYPMAKQFQENLARVSREDQGRMAGSMGGNVKQFNKAYYEDIHDALEPHGLGEDYNKAMTMSRRASQIRNAAKVGAGAAGTALVGNKVLNLARDLK